MANKDFYDRIADALEIISEDSSHIDDVDKNMDYYKRIAEALESIAEGAGGGGSGGGLVVHMVVEPGTATLDKTWAEIKTVVENGGCVYLADDDNFGVLTGIFPISSAQKYMVYFLLTGTNISFASTSPDEYPAFVTT